MQSGGSVYCCHSIFGTCKLGHHLLKLSDVGANRGDPSGIQAIFYIFPFIACYIGYAKWYQLLVTHKLYFLLPNIGYTRRWFSVNLLSRALPVQILIAFWPW